MATKTLEYRIVIVEQELERLKKCVDTDKFKCTTSGWEEMFGIFKDDPLFDEAERLGREWRESQDAIVEDESDVPA